MARTLGAARRQTGGVVMVVMKKKRKGRKKRRSSFAKERSKIIKQIRRQRGKRSWALDIARKTKKPITWARWVATKGKGGDLRGHRY